MLRKSLTKREAERLWDLSERFDKLTGKEYIEYTDLSDLAWEVQARHAIKTGLIGAGIIGAAVLGAAIYAATR